MKNKTRCKWCNLKNPLYVKYHDEEWGKPNFDDKYLLEMLILETFQAGLSWECILNSINNSKVYKNIQNKYGTFYNYLKMFTDNNVIYEINKTTSKLSDEISADLKKRGMTFVGSTTIYSYLQAIGIIYSHDKECFMYKEIN